MKLLNNFLILIIKFYKYFISPYFPSNCRYLPTCSEYFIDCLKLNGIFKGSYLGIEFTQEEIDRLFYTVKVILELSNIHDSESMYKIINKISSDLKFINEDETSLLDKFTKKYFKIGNEMIVKDLEYIQNISFRLDCYIIYKTIFKIFEGTGR